MIGAGHAGLAMSKCLTDRSIDHVLIERGEVANSWRTERWDSLRLLTPNWQSRLLGYGYEGDDPDGYREFLALGRATLKHFVLPFVNFVPVPGHWGTLPLSMKGAPNGTTSTEIYRRLQVGSG